MKIQGSPINELVREVLIEVSSLSPYFFPFYSFSFSFFNAAHPLARHRRTRDVLRARASHQNEEGRASSRAVWSAHSVNCANYTTCTMLYTIMPTIRPRPLLPVISSSSAPPPFSSSLSFPLIFFPSPSLFFSRPRRRAIVSNDPAARRPSSMGRMRSSSRCTTNSTWCL